MNRSHIVCVGVLFVSFVWLLRCCCQLLFVVAFVFVCIVLGVLSSFVVFCLNDVVVFVFCVVVIRVVFWLCVFC